MFQQAVDLARWVGVVGNGSAIKHCLSERNSSAIASSLLLLIFSTSTILVLDHIH